MAKRIRLSSISTDSGDTDWFKCCLCQGDTIESLISSAEGYQMLTKNIPLFNEVNALPIPTDIRRLDDGTRIHATLIGNNAKYHNSCRIKFNNTKLLRVQKRVKSHVPSTSLEESLKFFKGSIDLPESSTSTRIDMFQCSLCDKHSPMSDLREAMTMKLYQRLRDCAATLQDE